jgi:hypothetical protein
VNEEIRESREPRVIREQREIVENEAKRARRVILVLMDEMGL